jgi:hypothetical protein
MGILCGFCEQARNQPDIFNNDEIKNHDLKSRYLIGSKISSTGENVNVFEGSFIKNSHVKVAIKLLKINLLTDIEIKNVKNEIHIMKMFDH